MKLKSLICYIAFPVQLATFFSPAYFIGKLLRKKRHEPVQLRVWHQNQVILGIMHLNFLYMIIGDL